jgi:hypothetical protein
MLMKLFAAALPVAGRIVSKMLQTFITPFIRQFAEFVT